MSGIVGVFYRDGRPASHPVMERMLEKILHRGPDGQGIWCGGLAGLGQCTRCTTPESLRDRQPRLSQSADLVLVSDARIDNREELIRELASFDRPAREIPDSQIILSAYQRWGDLAPQKLIGDYVFAIWDVVNRRFFCARDAMGVKPLYYYLSNNCFAFASEIKSLLALENLHCRLDEDKAANYLLWSFEDTQATFYQDILKLKSAHTISVTIDGTHTQPYWSLDAQREVWFTKQQDYIDGFKEIFLASVQARMRSILPLGSTLSGGLDSSSIACTIQQLKQKKGSSRETKVISALFHDLPERQLSKVDESKYIRAVIDHGGYDQVCVYPEQFSPLLNQTEIYSLLDEPFFAPTQFIFWAIYAGAKDAGIGVLLDGTDGDSAVSHGEAYLAQLAWSLQWRSLYNESAQLAKNNGRSQRSILWSEAIKPVLPISIAKRVQRLRRKRNTGWDGQNLLSHDFLNRVGIREDENRFGGSQPPRFTNARVQHVAELASGLNPLAMELFDKLSTAFSLEVRFPFFDRRLIEYCLAIPPDLILHKGFTRYILRAAMQDTLPEEILWRTGKADLTAVFCHQLLLKEGERLYKAIFQERDFLLGMVNREMLQNAYARFIADPYNHTVEAYALFGAVTLNHWLKFSHLG